MSNLSPRKSLFRSSFKPADLRFELKWQNILAETLVKRRKIPYGLPNRIGYTCYYFLACIEIEGFREDNRKGVGGGG
jgi:hypothetical protein